MTERVEGGRLWGERNISISIYTFSEVKQVRFKLEHNRKIFFYRTFHDNSVFEIAGRPVNLPVGQLLSYPFSFQLPSDLPSSLEDEYGYVKYYIRAIFERPSNPDFIIQLDCNVFSNCDLNELPQARVSRGIFFTTLSPTVKNIFFFSKFFHRDQSRKR